MVDTTNLINLEYKKSDEIKALSNEILKTIRDIIHLNPLYRDSITLLMQGAHGVTDNPVYLSDLGAALTSADSKEQQEVLEELNVRKLIFLINLNSFKIIRFQKDLGCRLSSLKKSLQ